MQPARKILLVEPVFHVHTLSYWDAALSSSGFEDAEFTLAAFVNEAQRKRAEEWAAGRDRVRLALVNRDYDSLPNRWQALRAVWRAMRHFDGLIAREHFEHVGYTYFDHSLPFLSFGFLRRRLPHHSAVGVSGVVFRDNGLRPSGPGWKARLRAAVDRLVLGLAVRSPAVKRLAFLDPAAARRGREIFKSDRITDAVDPVRLREPLPDKGACRAALGVAADSFTVLILGALGGRKATVPTLELLANFDSPRPVTVLIGGTMEPAARAEILRAISLVKPRHMVVHCDGYVPEATKEDWFGATDLVLCAYRDFAGSSGILLHAGAFGKPALVSPGGVMEDAVRRFGFGEVVSLDDAPRFHQALRKFASVTPAEEVEAREKALAFARANDARQFLSRLF